MASHVDLVLKVPPPPGSEEVSSQPASPVNRVQRRSIFGKRLLLSLGHREPHLSHETNASPKSLFGPGPVLLGRTAQPSSPDGKTNDRQKQPANTSEAAPVMQEEILGKLLAGADTDKALIASIQAARESIHRLFQDIDGDGNGILTAIEVDALKRRMQVARGFGHLSSPALTDQERRLSDEVSFRLAASLAAAGHSADQTEAVCDGNSFRECFLEIAGAIHREGLQRNGMSPRSANSLGSDASSRRAGHNEQLGTPATAVTGDTSAQLRRLGASGAAGNKMTPASSTTSNSRRTMEKFGELAVGRPCTSSNLPSIAGTNARQSCGLDDQSVAKQLMLTGGRPSVLNRTPRALSRTSLAKQTHKAVTMRLQQM